jgi:hypothetical protein
MTDGALPVDAVVPDAPGSDAEASMTDAASMCAEAPCRLVSPQCGCGVGDGCYFDPTSGMRVCEPAGATIMNARCAGAASCLPGFHCTGPTGLEFCHRYCATDDECPGEGGLCVLSLRGPGGDAVPDARVCTNPCDPVSSTGCPDGLGCSVRREREGAMRTFTLCRAAGPGAQGDPCVNEDLCGGGFACILGACARFCQIGIDTCPAGTSCGPFDPALRLGARELGVCS